MTIQLFSHQTEGWPQCCGKGGWSVIGVTKSSAKNQTGVIAISDSENFLAIAFFPVSNNPFVFTHFLPEMSRFPFARQISLWTTREGALCTFSWGLFHPFLPDFFPSEAGFGSCCHLLLLALAPPSVPSSFCPWGDEQRSRGCAGALPASVTTWSSLIPREEWTRSPPQIVSLLYGAEPRDVAKIVLAQRARKERVLCARGLYSGGRGLELEVKFPVCFCMAHMPHSEQELQPNKFKAIPSSSQAGELSALKEAIHVTCLWHFDSQIHLTIGF